MPSQWLLIILQLFLKKKDISAFQEILHRKLSDASNANKLERETHVLTTSLLAPLSWSDRDRRFFQVSSEAFCNYIYNV